MNKSGTLGSKCHVVVSLKGPECYAPTTLLKSSQKAACIACVELFVKYSGGQEEDLQ